MARGIFSDGSTFAREPQLGVLPVLALAASAAVPALKKALPKLLGKIGKKKKKPAPAPIVVAPPVAPNPASSSIPTMYVVAGGVGVMLLVLLLDRRR